MKKKTIEPVGFQPIGELQPFTFKDLQEFSYSLADLSSELQEFSGSDFEIFSDEELKAMAFTIRDLKAMAFTKEELKAISWNLDSPSDES